jgi:hypothetical protein
MSYRASNRFTLPLATLLVTLGACGDDTGTTTGDPPDPPGKQLRPGDICTDPLASFVTARFVPDTVFLPPCAEGDDACTTRTVKLRVAPDVCKDTPVTFTSSDPSLAAPSAGTVGLYEPEITVELSGAAAPGEFTISASVPLEGADPATAQLRVVVLDPALQPCEGPSASGAVTPGTELAGSGELTGATIGLPANADAPNQGSFLWSVPEFDGEIACGEQALPDGYVALGPAITFGPTTTSLPREIPMTIPLNPARMGSSARFRHLRVLYSSPAFPEPRVVPIADPRIGEVDGEWALSFKAPRLGTYQAVVLADAGERVVQRRITHRAVIGVSMGGMGSSMFGVRNHERFDVVAPLGGPASWSWLIHHIEKFHLGGFRPIAPGTELADIPLTKVECMTDSECAADEACLGVTDAGPGGCTFLEPAEHPYEHPQTFNNWWAEYPRTGTGGGFPRQDYSQIFRDLALLMGNPNGDNLAPNGENLPPGVPPNHPSVVGERDTRECAVWVDPIDDAPDVDAQRERADNCPLERCANPLTLQSYYDDEYNPDGTFPVITVCDGTPTNEDKTPYANAWTSAGPNNYPLEVGLAVDYNGNGVRDELEPIVRSGHEPWRDTGPDGLASIDEPGYQPGVNEDPSGDDYDMQFNPGGTEGNYRYDAGEPYLDVGMDGVPNTPQQPPTGWASPGDGYDVGEGDGQFTASRGLRRMWEYDPGAILRKNAPSATGELDDDALDRLDLWTDGGLRDIFNFHIAANQLSGAMVARGRDTAYYTSFAALPGFDPSEPDLFTPALVPWDDLPGSMLMRYGQVDPTPKDIEDGSGQHVGTLNEIIFRLQTALYFIGSRWQDEELRSVVKVSSEDPAPGAIDCEIVGACTFEFTDSRGRKGPVTVNLPPGYAHREQQDRTYPVIYMLHGYGQTPEDLGAAIIFVANWMNGAQDTVATRLPKAILVYVDGRCRTDEDGNAECIRGNFFVDSGRDDGMKAEAWWLELMDHVDANFRTREATTIDWRP